jgi:DNA invertase Pin-like site-specific DNA recombinase
MMVAFTELARNIIRKRQAEGVAKAKAGGVYQNHTRKPVSDCDAIRKLKVEGLSTHKITDQMGIPRKSVHWILNNAA